MYTIHVFLFISMVNSIHNFGMDLIVV